MALFKRALFASRVMQARAPFLFKTVHATIVELSVGEWNWARTLERAREETETAPLQSFCSGVKSSFTNGATTERERERERLRNLECVLLLARSWNNNNCWMLDRFRDILHFERHLLTHLTGFVRVRVEEWFIQEWLSAVGKDKRVFNEILACPSSASSRSNLSLAWTKTKVSKVSRLSCARCVNGFLCPRCWRRT